MSASMTRKGYTKRRILLAAIICIAIILVVFSGYCVKQLTYNKVYNGVYINSVDVSGLTRDELSVKIPEIFDKRLSKTVTLKIDSVEYTFDTLSLSPAIDVEKMTDSAFSYGRTKRFLSRLSEISGLKKNPKDVPFYLTFNDAELQKTIDKAISSLDITAVPNKIEYGEDSLNITRGKAGNGVLFSEVKASIENCILNDTDIATADFKYIEPEEITYDYISRFVSDKPIEASYSIENHRIIYVESQPGISLSKGDLERAINAADGDVIKIPAKITQPKMTSEELHSTVLAHELGKYTTDYSSSSADRAYNIKLACEKINGYILAPGEEFSYNDVVGPRTVERGFRIANVYVGNTVQPGIGGGICQVSSTMYNSVVFADLEITARRNHTLPVSYVPLGRDATVSYGATDFKFKNNTNMPIEIKAIAEGGLNTVTIIGTDDHPEREIKIVTSQTGTSSPKVIIEKDPELLEGEIKVESKGTNGSSHISYKVVYENGVEVSRTQLAKSVYAGKDRVEIHGTKKVEEVPPEVTVPEAPAPAPEPETPDVPQNTTEETPAV